MNSAARAGHFSERLSRRKVSRFDQLCHNVLIHVRAYDHQGLELTVAQMAEDLRMRLDMVEECVRALVSLQLVKRHRNGVVLLDQFGPAAVVETA